jgi:hypothetical protein
MDHDCPSVGLSLSLLVSILSLSFGIIFSFHTRLGTTLPNFQILGQRAILPCRRVSSGWMPGGRWNASHLRAAPPHHNASALNLFVVVAEHICCYTSKTKQSPQRHTNSVKMREIVHVQAGQCGNQIGAKFWEVRAVICE